MKINRLFEMVYILVNRRSVTAKELAEHFEVSIRTIYRDIDALTSANTPIYTTQGKGGGTRTISFIKKFYLKPTSYYV